MREIFDPLISSDGGTFTKRVRLRPNRALDRRISNGGALHIPTYRLSSRTKPLSTVINEESTKKLQWSDQLKRHRAYQNHHTLGIVGVIPRSVEDSDG